MEVLVLSDDLNLYMSATASVSMAALILLVAINKSTPVARRCNLASKNRGERRV